MVQLVNAQKTSYFEWKLKTGRNFWAKVFEHFFPWLCKKKQLPVNGFVFENDKKIVEKTKNVSSSLVLDESDQKLFKTNVFHLVY